MKKYRVFFLALLLLLLTGCNSVSIRPEYGSADVTFTPTPIGGPVKTFNFGSSINVCYGYNSKEEALNYQINVSEDQVVPLTVLYCYSPDESISHDYGIVRMYVFEDGEPVPFTVETYGEKQTHEVWVMPEADVTFNIEVPMKASAKNYCISMFACAEHIPEKVETLEYNGSIHYHILNTASEKTDVSSPQVAYVEYSGVPGIDVGKEMIANNKLDAGVRITEDRVVGEEDKLYVKFYSKIPEYDYRLLVFVDEEPVLLNGEQYSLYVEMHGKEYAAVLEIPKECLGRKGLHTVRAVAIPICIADSQPENTTAYASKKIRVVVE